MAQLSSIFYILCFFWICRLEISARSYDDSDRDIQSKAHISNTATDARTGDKRSGSDIRNADRPYTGDVRDVENDNMYMTLGKLEDASDNKILLKEIDSFLNSKRARKRKQKKWLDKDGARGTSTTATTAIPPPQTPPPQTPDKTCHKICLYFFGCFEFCI